MNHPEDGDKIGRLRELMFEQVCNKRYEGLDLGRTSETVCDKTLVCQKAELELFGCQCYLQNKVIQFSIEC